MTAQDVGRMQGELDRLIATLAGKSYEEQKPILAEIHALGMERKRVVEEMEARP